jgi:hypothetical protein
MEKNERAAIAIIGAYNHIVFYYSEENGGLMRATQDLALSIGMSILEQNMKQEASVVLLEVPDSVNGSDEQVAAKLISIMDADKERVIAEHKSGRNHFSPSQIRSKHLKSFRVEDRTELASGFLAAMDLISKNAGNNDLDLLSKKLESGEFSPEDFGCPDPDKRN